MDEKENEEQACEQWQEGLKKLGARVLGGVRLEAERLNGGPRLVPACNSGLTPGNYWIPHRICQPLSSLLFCFFRIVLALLCLTGSFCSCTIDLPSTFLSFGVRLPSPPFPRHFSLPSHLPVPPMSCLLMSWALASSLFFHFPWQSAVALFRWARLKCSTWDDKTTLLLQWCFFFVVVVFLSSPSNTLLILFSVSLSLPRNSYSLCSCCLLIMSYGQPHAKGVLKPCRRLRARRYG